MPRPHELTDDALIAQAHEWRRRALQGDIEAREPAREHEIELRDRMRHSAARAEPPVPLAPTPSPVPPQALGPEECRVATSDTASDAMTSAVSTLLKNVRELLSMDIAFVAEFSQDRWICRQIEAGPQRSPTLHTGWSELRTNTYCQRVVEERLPAFIPDTSARPDTRELAITRQLDIGAYLSAPVVLPDGTLYGTLCCISHQARSALGSRQVDALRTVANLVSREIDRNRRGRSDTGV